MRRSRLPGEPRKISITYVLMALMGAGFVYMVVTMSQDINEIYDRVDRRLVENAISYTQAIPMKKGGPTVVLMKNDPFRESGRWHYVSSRHPLSKDYMPPALERLAVPQGAGQPMRVVPMVNDALKRLFIAAEKDGILLIISSAYRSDREQRALYRQYAEAYDAATARQYVADPRESEHATGLAVDINTYSEDCVTNLDYCAISVAAADWLKKHAPDYGFILRYPPDKTSVTGVAGESWHYRYVGDGARALTDAGLTLDELVDKVEPGLLR